MSKKKEIKIDGSLVATVTNNLNKHGEIRGENKKQTKILRAACPHHKINKKGKIKPTVYNDGNGNCTCYLCGAKFGTKLYSKEETKEMCGKVKKILDQARFMNQAADLGKESGTYLAKLSVDLSALPKTYGKIKKAVERTEHIKNRKKKNRNGNNNSGSSYGAWR